jgi:hypothetical protein
MLTEVGAEGREEVGTEVAVPVEPETPATPSEPEVRVDVETEVVVPSKPELLVAVGTAVLAPVEASTPDMPSKPVANNIPAVEPEPILTPMVAIEPSSS